MRKFVLIIAILVCIGCQHKREKAFDSFDFAFLAPFWQDFSLKLTQSDTIFIRYHWIRDPLSNDQDVSLQNVKTNITYYGLLEKKDRQALFDSIAKTDFKKFDDKYTAKSTSDGLHYQFVFQKDSIEKKVTMYVIMPQQLRNISSLIHEIKKKTKLLPTNRFINFKANIMLSLKSKDLKIE